MRCELITVRAGTDRYTNVSALVDVVVGQLEFLEGQRLRGEQLAAGQRRVGVPVELSSGGVRRVRLAGDHPRRPVVGVAVALGVDRHHVQQHQVLGVDVDAGAAEAHPQCREHPPASRRRITAHLTIQLVIDVISAGASVIRMYK